METIKTIKVTDATLCKFAGEFAVHAERGVDLIMTLPESFRREVAANSCQPAQEKAVRAGFAGFWASKPNGSVTVEGRTITRQEVLRDAPARKKKGEEDSPYMAAYRALQKAGQDNVSQNWKRFAAACRASLTPAAPVARETLDIRQRVQRDLEDLADRLTKAAASKKVDFDKAAFGAAIKAAMAAIKLV
jgi:hypothetical protein